MNQVINLQRKIKFDLDAVREFTASLPEKIDETVGRSFSIAFINDARMKQLNSTFRGKDWTTDVLSFPFEAQPFEPGSKNLGDIVISAEQAQKQATENGLSLEGEIKQLILHGVLHLCGYDHETDSGEMNARELELRDKLGI
ncbi:MAG TPA: rRNA maturation RNase YbeY [Pyrinomonadaceae bacterium]|nr:rRNA maturation RNase YbeY [Pyrinomonadaceae bacterium]